MTFLLLLTLLSHSLWSQNYLDSNKVVRVLSFNILHGATTQHNFDLDVIARVIKESKADLVALQEVDLWTNRAKKYDLASELGKRTNMLPLFGRAMKYDGGEYGEAILSKYSFIQSKNHPLPHSPGNEPRAALEVVVELPSTDSISFIGTHLDHTKNQKDRIAQALKINELFSTHAYPAILAGDLNAVPESETINILEKIWTSSYDPIDPVATYPSDDPQKKIDYIMFIPENRWKVLEKEIICDPIASDHCAYLVVLQLLDQQKKEN